MQEFITMQKFWTFWEKMHSGSIVANEGKPRCAFASKLNLQCITPRIIYGIGKDNRLLI